jgi:chromosome segregation ATPase
MKSRLGIVILILICAGLVIALILTRKQAADQRAGANDRISSYSNKWVNAGAELEKAREVNAQLESDRAQKNESLLNLSNNLAQTSDALQTTKSTLKTTQDALKSTQDQLAQRDARITELESQNQSLDQKAAELGESITNLTTQIADTQKKLAASEGDKAFLEKELQRLMNEKAELERQFNDLSVLRAQVAKLKEELNMSRRLDWIRKGLFTSTEQKGAQKLMHLPAANSAASPAPPEKKPTYDLNVEVSSDGTVRVIPPATNSPSATNPPSQ